jgi:hypothetical protein
MLLLTGCALPTGDDYFEEDFGGRAIRRRKLYNGARRRAPRSRAPTCARAQR